MGLTNVEIYSEGAFLYQKLEVDVAITTYEL